MDAFQLLAQLLQFHFVFSFHDLQIKKQQTSIFNQDVDNGKFAKEKRKSSLTRTTGRSVVLTV